jgi:hypothetical protein
MAHNEYLKNGGHAKLFALSPFKKDGHYLFSDPAGIPLWREEVRSFLQGIGFKITPE